MGLFFANPWGLLGLLALPAIVVVHCLQERSRRVRTSTLFLLEHSQPVNEGGLRFERFHSSLPFWMQLLAALALSWLLADPRWVTADSRQTVAVVLDSSASMRACRERTLETLARRLRSWEAAAARTDWHLLETGPRRPPLYAGNSLKQLLDAAAGWNPTLGTHGFDDALAVAAAVVPPGGGGTILVTDRPVETPVGVAVLSAGEAFDNVGFSGGRVEEADGRRTWRVLVTNHGDSRQTREFSVGEPRADGPTRPLRKAAQLALDPGQSLEFSGDWPEFDRIVLSLSPDRFDRDDLLPLVRPVPRRVRVARLLSGTAGELLSRMVAACSDVELIDTVAEADFVIEPFGAGANRSGVQTPVDAAQSTDAAQGADAVEDAGAKEHAGDKQAEPQEVAAAGTTAPKSTAFDPAWIAAEATPLTRDLGWGGLLSGPAGNLLLTATDEPLLWKGGRPLAFVRTLRGDDSPVETLVLNWDIAASTAARTPAVVVLLQRFVDRVRSRIDRGWADNVETGQQIELPRGMARAPDAPGFFSLPPERPLVTGAAQFADSRECDFRAAAPVDTLDGVLRGQLLKRSIQDPWAPLWIVVTVSALVIAWMAGRGAATSATFPGRG
jgi:hypothetical protein